MNKQFAVFALWLAGMLGAVPAACASDDPEADKQFLMTHSQADSRFLASIERVGECKISTPPELKGIRVPWQIYPKESVDKLDEDTVTFELIFDPDWCVCKTRIVQSTAGDLLALRS